MRMKKENNKLQMDIEKDTKRYSDQIKKLNDKLENEVKKQSQLPRATLPRTMVNNDFDQQLKSWAKEKELLEKQLNMANAQIEESRKINDSIMHSNKNFEKTRVELQESNNKLTEVLRRSDTRNYHLESKINKLRPYKKIIEYTESIKCKYCDEMFIPTDFPKHVQICQPSETNPFDVSGQMQPISMKNIPSESRYKIEDSEQYENFQNMSQNQDLSESMDSERSYSRAQQMYEPDYSNILKKILHCMSTNPEIRDSMFNTHNKMETDKRFADEFGTNYDKNLPHPSVSRATMQVNNSMSNLDLNENTNMNNRIMSPKGRPNNMFNSAVNQNSTNVQHSPSADTDDDDACVIEEP